MAARRTESSHHRRGRNGQDDGDRIRAACHRRGGSTAWRAWRNDRANDRAAVSRDPRLAHLRGCDRSPAADHRQGDVYRTSGNTMTSTAHVDTFARDNLPPREQWPDLVFDLPHLHYPARLNAADELLDRALERGFAERTAIVAPSGLRWTYAELLQQSNRIAHALVEDLGVVPGNRVLLRAPNTPLIAACWFAVLKAGAIAVPTMPLLRAKELTDVIVKAEVSHALCDARLAVELDNARAACPSLRTVAWCATDAADGLEALARGKPPSFDNVRTAADDTAVIAFTSGTTGKPKGTMHFHRDLLAACDCWPRAVLRATGGGPVTSRPPLAFTFGLGGLLLFPLRIGAATLLLEKPAPDALLAAIAEHKATVLFT